MIRLFSLGILFALLFGCGPIYKQEYSYVAPRTTAGTMCISQCVQNKNMCEQMCQMKNDNCRAQARADAAYQFEAYKQERYAQGKKIEKSFSNFDNSYACSDTCNCRPTFNGCYSACGGQIVSKKICVAFCDKK